MKKLITICAVVLMVNSMVLAATTTVTALTTDGSGWGAAMPVASTDAAPGFGPGSFQANGTAKSNYYVSPQQLFGRDVTIGELASISYFTKKDTTHAVDTSDWFIAIYTKPYEGGHATWYGDRINSEPYFSQSISETAGTWTQWVTGAGQNNRLRFFDSNINFGTYNDPFLSDLTSNSAYRDQKIGSFSIQTGSAWAPGFTGLVDGLSVGLTDGSVGQVNMVPEPATMALLGLGGLLLRRKK